MMLLILVVWLVLMVIDCYQFLINNRILLINVSLKRISKSKLHQIQDSSQDMLRVVLKIWIVLALIWLACLIKSRSCSLVMFVEILPKYHSLVLKDSRLFQVMFWTYLDCKDIQNLTRLSKLKILMLPSTHLLVCNLMELLLESIRITSICLPIVPLELLILMLRLSLMNLPLKQLNTPIWEYSVELVNRDTENQENWLILKI